ncbi:MAG: plasmid pRiA4b ORF-3 family protein [Desulfobulbaceae bacterium]|jgi:hypothetical protein|nr:plasmid pRiA4b ORF-3 family protein [Desulfobulbaceae bacterium]
MIQKGKKTGPLAGRLVDAHDTRTPISVLEEPAMATIIQLPKSTRNTGGAHGKKAEQPSMRCILVVRLTFASLPFWRRIDVSGQASLFDLHRIIQIVIGWDDSAAHQFMVGKMLYRTFAGRPLRLDESQYDERRARLQSLTERMRFIFQYFYEAENSWECSIDLEATQDVSAAEAAKEAILLAGQGKFPDHEIEDVYALDAFRRARLEADEEYLTDEEIGVINDQLRAL